MQGIGEGRFYQRSHIHMDHLVATYSCSHFVRSEFSAVGCRYVSFAWNSQSGPATHEGRRSGCSASYDGECRRNR